MRCRNGKPKPLIHDATNCSWLEVPCQEMHFTASTRVTCERKIRNQQQKDLFVFHYTLETSRMQPFNMEVDGKWLSDFPLGDFRGSMLIFRGVDFSEFRPLQNNMAPNSDGTSDLHQRCWVTEEMQQKTSVKHISQPFHSPQQEPSTRKKVFFTPSIYITLNNNNLKFHTLNWCNKKQSSPTDNQQTFHLTPLITRDLLVGKLLSLWLISRTHP